MEPYRTPKWKPWGHFPNKGKSRIAPSDGIGKLSAGSIVFTDGATPVGMQVAHEYMFGRVVYDIGRVICK